ncbi:ATP phosphoribosyltransferase regulatory subunit [Staphylococcus canis]|uniref:ATP phosphoribosyltransferase regulatory subunit n=1 Tax=Staphylococcus canis TaxID=2724942 RepID=A0ABS0T6R2_9STAP|nr:ATP phosphoribosyltransferase regulatory subunit [Staphylococcus canis]MBI5974423.1 ATP phosphoribosyltransferase regulatory subunit [Staphylococcus canis]
MESPLELKSLEVQFLKYFSNQGYTLIDTSFIETLQWSQLSTDDLKQMDERSIWQNHDQLYALRNDFTDQLVRYYQNYPLQAQSIAYSGPIVRHQNVRTQLGIECYDPTIQDIHQAFEHFNHYIQSEMNTAIQYVVIGHYQLIDLLLKPEFQTEAILTAITQRNISELKKQLGIEHPIVQLLLTPTHKQLDALNELYTVDHSLVSSLNRWASFFKSLGLTDIHLDITPMAPRSYYKGTFVKAYLEDERVVSGGYYDNGLEGFGLGLTL